SCRIEFQCLLKYLLRLLPAAESQVSNSQEQEILGSGRTQMDSFLQESRRLLIVSESEQTVSCSTQGTFIVRSDLECLAEMLQSIPRPIGVNQHDSFFRESLEIARK